MADPLRINLALQGGGAHGAFTWGVLDRLLDEENLEVAAITGTSAGALNAAAFKAGMVMGGRDGARENLDWLWGQMGGMGDLRLTTLMGVLEPPQIAQGIEFSLPFSLADTWSRMVSPYMYGPFYFNPLEPIVKAMDFDSVCAEAAPELFIGATRVSTGKIRVFSGSEICTEAILASACLPNLFQAVEIKNPETGETEAFWDGGYTGNPALFPLFQPHLPSDIMVVNVYPLERAEPPRSPQEIADRINEISFNSSLLRELRSIDLIQRLMDEGELSRDRMKRVHVHMISDDKLMRELSVTTKMMPMPSVLARLKQAGRDAAERFLEQGAQHIGKRNSVDLKQMFD
ncbi:MAG: patatin-like phospholipase family protein [Pseudodonghicola sp.]|nr:patatin-like phospholipase family protein [Pseudodonghicola sp.]